MFDENISRLEAVQIKKTHLLIRELLKLGTIENQVLVFDHTMTKKEQS